MFSESRDKRSILGSLDNCVLNRRAPDEASTSSRNNPMTSREPARQHKLRQRFTVIKKLGKGTYGKVQLAINKQTGQEVAIKTIKKTKIENEQDLQRVRREIQIMSSIEHPHIIHIYEVFENKDKIVLVMQYAPGGELYEYISQSKFLTDQEARRLFRQIATAIFYCHQNKICHRDLKLENILLDEKRNAKIADFGLSNVFDKRRQLDTFCGSPLYASPEIVQGCPYEGPEVDCWSLGVLLYTLVYGAMPFDGTNFKRLVKQINEASYFEPEQRSPASALIGRLLCADSSKRATIIDICTDPWVNGLHLIPESPRRSPDDSQQQIQVAHNSLLKVAQDMANLTPVRLDILLALMPKSPIASAIDAKPPTTNNRSTEQAAMDEQLEQPREPSYGSELLAEASPVASFVVRDLEKSDTAKYRDQLSSPMTKTEPMDLVEVNVDREDPPEDSSVIISLEEPMDTEPDNQPREPREVSNEDKIDDNEKTSEVIIPSLEEPEAPADTEKVIETSKDHVTEPTGSDLNEGAKDVPSMDSSDLPPVNDETSGIVDKPKKVKKKVVVVKRKKKVSKKEVATENESKEKDNNGDVKTQESISTPVKPKLDTSSPVSAKVPGKVRIPSTFTDSTTDHESGDAEQKVSCPEIRRPSAMIADVSQKLLQQTQNISTGTSAATVAVDQPQLANVRVSDKRNEFERRASLASPLNTGTSKSSSPLQMLAIQDVEPQRVDDIQETIRLSESIGELIIEPVNKLEPSEVADLKRAFEELDELAAISQTLTPKATNYMSGEQPKLNLEPTVTEERSDSTETIKADVTEQINASTNQTQPTIRSSLNIDLSGVQSLRDRTTGIQPSSSRSQAEVPGPAPIARSYKKVTFTKDGACITETGKIYSTRCDDGTFRRVERKSKFTHYPSDASTTANSQAHESSLASEQFNEEIVYDEADSDCNLSQWHRSTGHKSADIKSKIRRPFERLIMPSAEINDNSFIDDFPHRSLFSRQTQHHQYHQPLDRTDSASSCSSGSNDLFDDIFDTWTGAISMFHQGSGSQKRHTQKMIPSFGTPNSLAGDSMFATLRRNKRHSKAPSSLSGTARCESVEPQARFWSPTPSHSGDRHPGPTQLGTGGYQDSRPSSYDRPSTSLGSARSHFGSTNILNNPHESEIDPFANRPSPLESLEPIGHRLLANSGLEPSSLAQEIEEEHKNIHRKLTQSFWKGSTPSLFAPMSAEPMMTRPPLAWQRAKSPNPSANVIRASVPLSSAPNRRNTANLNSVHQLPPRQPPSVRRSISKGSVITNQMANMSISNENQNQRAKQHHVATFIELKRPSASLGKLNCESHNAKMSTDQKIDSGVTHPSERSSDIWCDTSRADISRPYLHQEKIKATQTNKENMDSRIQNWLQDSSGSNDLTPSASNRSSTLDTLLSYPSSSDQQSIIKDEPKMPVQQQVRTLCEPVTYRRSANLITSTDCRDDGSQVQMIESRAKSEISDSIEQIPTRDCTINKNVSVATKTSSTLITLRPKSPKDLKEDRPEPVRHFVRKEMSQHEQQVSTNFTPTPDTNIHGLNWIQAVDSNSRSFGGQDTELDGDSLSGTGSAELESRSSSSLLDQLRSRGYRSLINQRIVSNDPQQSQQQSQLVTSTSSTTSLIEGGARVITTTMTTTTSGTQILKQEIESPQSIGIFNLNNNQMGGKPSEDRKDSPVENNHQSISQIPVQEEENQQIEGMEALRQVEAEQTNGDIEEDEDEDEIKRAKANIKSHLDRVRETEKFLKAVREAEENLDRQRQESFLMNNLIFATRFNALSTRTNRSTDDFEVNQRVPRSAPINWLTKEPETNGYLSTLSSSAFEPTPMPTNAPACSSFHPSISNFSTPKYNLNSEFLSSPSQSMATNFDPILPSRITRRVDPLESVKPIVVSGIYPKSKFAPVDQSRSNWRRSKSQINDQFIDYRSRRPNFSWNTDRLQPEDSNSDIRKRRSSSQIRYQPSESSPKSGMLSEYQASFGLKSRLATSPVRVPSPTNSVKDDTDESDDGMNAYRASSYVPKVLPEYPSMRPSRDFRRRTLRDSSDKYSFGFSSTRNKDDTLQAYETRLQPDRQRRTSLQNYLPVGNYNWNKDTRVAKPDSPESPPVARESSRRNSYTVENLQSVTIPAENTRLSELEQRIRANQRRRDNLLAGRYTPEPNEQQEIGAKNRSAIETCD